MWLLPHNLYSGVKHIPLFSQRPLQQYYRMFIVGYQITCTKSGVKRSLSLSFFLLQFMTSQRKLYMVGICSTVQKRAKRTLDATVETTHLMPLKKLTHVQTGTRLVRNFHNLQIKWWLHQNSQPLPCSLSFLCMN